MTSALMKSVSGIRGIVGESLTPEVIVKVASAFAEYTGHGTVVIGRDTRPTGDAISRGVESVLSLTGCDVVNIGIATTPTVQIMVEELKADGGLVISASHNPIQWNAFKLIGKNGTFLNSKEIRAFFQLMDEVPDYCPWNKIGLISRNRDADSIHINRVLDVIDTDAVKSKKYTVVLDSVNGAGSEVTQKLLDELGCRVVPIHCTMDGTFPRGAEPLQEHLSDLSEAVKKYGAHIGFAQDPDADRLALVDETGRPIGEENTIALVTEHLLSKSKGRVVINLSTTRAVDDIAIKHGVPLARTRVGEINVVDEMIRAGARIGGEGNGGIISPEVHLGRDSLVGIGYILEMMALRGASLSSLVKELPGYVMRKGKVPVSSDLSISALFNKIKSDFPHEKISDIDGLRIEFINHSMFNGGWVHLRASNTEPVFRIIAEGKTTEQAENIYRNFMDIVRS